MNADAVEKALREALTAHDAAIVMDPAEGLPLRNTLSASPLRESLLMGEVESLRAETRKGAGLREAIREIADQLDGNDPMQGPGYGEFADMLYAAIARDGDGR
jgi:hypothetical protein